jgi:hypothetical protein
MRSVFLGSPHDMDLWLLQANNCYIFPGVALGCLLSGATRCNDEMFLRAGTSTSNIGQRTYALLLNWLMLTACSWVQYLIHAGLYEQLKRWQAVWQRRILRKSSCTQLYPKSVTSLLELQLLWQKWRMRRVSMATCFELLFHKISLEFNVFDSGLRIPYEY